MIPKIEFVYSWIYNQTFFMLLKREWKLEYLKPSLRYTKKLEKEWKKIDKKVLKEMENVTGMRWKDKEITCFLVNHCVHSFSWPLTVIISGGEGKFRRVDHVIDILVHELIHNLFSDNGVYKLDKQLGFDKEFKDELRTTKAHIYLHALHKQLYLKFFNKRRLVRDIASAKYKSMPGYDRAWEIVEQYGHENLLKRLRNAIKKNKSA